MSTQVNIRLDKATVEQIDGWAVIRGLSRPELVRQALMEWLHRREDERVGEAYRKAYAEHPETDEEMLRAEENAYRAIEEEPWERPW